MPGCDVNSSGWGSNVGNGSRTGSGVKSTTPSEGQKVMTLHDPAIFQVGVFRV